MFVRVRYRDVSGRASEKSSFLHRFGGARHSQGPSGQIPSIISVSSVGASTVYQEEEREMTGEMMGEMTGDPVGLVHAIRAGDSVLAPPDLKRGTVLNTQIVRIDRECHIRIQMSTLMNNTRHIPRGVTSGRRPRRSSMSGCLIFTGENALSHTHPDVNKQGTDTFGGGQIWLERTSCVPRATSQIIMAHLAGESAVRDHSA